MMYETRLATSDGAHRIQREAYTYNPYENTSISRPWTSPSNKAFKSEAGDSYSQKNEPPPPPPNQSIIEQTDNKAFPPNYRPWSSNISTPYAGYYKRHSSSEPDIMKHTPGLSLLRELDISEMRPDTFPSKPVHPQTQSNFDNSIEEYQKNGHNMQQYGSYTELERERFNENCPNSLREEGGESWRPEWGRRQPQHRFSTPETYFNYHPDQNSNRQLSSRSLDVSYPISEKNYTENMIGSRALSGPSNYDEANEQQAGVRYPPCPEHLQPSTQMDNQSEVPIANFQNVCSNGVRGSSGLPRGPVFKTEGAINPQRPFEYVNRCGKLYLPPQHTASQPSHLPLSVPRKLKPANTRPPPPLIPAENLVSDPIKVTVNPRRCSECGKTDTPQWRRGPGGSVNRCNACGLKYKHKQHKQCKAVVPKSRRRQTLANHQVATSCVLSSTYGYWTEQGLEKPYNADELAAMPAQKWQAEMGKEGVEKAVPVGAPASGHLFKPYEI